MLYGKENAWYARAIETHKRHAGRQGSSMYVLEHEVTDGFWNKPTYILSLLVAELAKHPRERSMWLMWVDGDSIIINPEIMPQIFLPPPDFNNVNFLVTKDHNGMNTGVFFLRVCDWSVKFMSKVLAYPLFRPDVDLGRSADQSAMELVAQEEGFRGATLYQPRVWYNTYEFHHGYEGDAGRMLVHFPGLEQDRWAHMAKWLMIVEGAQAAKWRIALEETEYPGEIHSFWSALRGAREVLQSAQLWVKSHPDVGPNLMATLAETRDIMYSSTDRVEAVVNATRRLNNLLGSYNDRY